MFSKFGLTRHQQITGGKIRAARQRDVKPELVINNFGNHRWR